MGFRNKREKNEEGRVTLGRLLPVNGDIKKRDGQRREKNPKEKKRLFTLFFIGIKLKKYEIVFLL